MADEPRRHFSLFRDFHLADVLTLGNAACGTGAVFAAMKYLQSGARGFFYLAALLCPIALVFDALDGRVARSRHTHSLLGRELDSLADVISFGVAPAALGFALLAPLELTLEVSAGCLAALLLGRHVKILHQA